MDWACYQSEPVHGCAWLYCTEDKTVLALDVNDAAELVRTMRSERNLVREGGVNKYLYNRTQSLVSHTNVT